MSREWKPGDVALVSHRLYDDDDTLTTHRRLLRRDGKWYGADGWVANDPDAAREIRPLVVIDPEDREQVERVFLAIESQYRADPADAVEGYDVTCYQRGLRSLTTDPKPDEPQGLGAVVEDAEGQRWVRDVAGQSNVDDEGEWYRRGVTRCHRYADITAVKVLSEGVTS